MAKKKSSSFDWTAFKNDLEKYARNICKNAAGQIRDELTETAFSGIVLFYTSYAPKKYKRHYYNFMDNSFRKYYSNPHNKIYRGGVEFTPELLDDIYQDTAYEVFGSVVELGSHGPELYTKVPSMSISPMQMVLDKRDEILDNIGEYIDNAKAKARQDSYSVLFS